MDFRELIRRAEEFGTHLEQVKASVDPPAGVRWYPKMLPGRIEVIERLLVGDYRALLEEPSSSRIADIGAADGDLGFFLETVGFEVDIYDGADRPALLKDRLGSNAELHFVDLDHDFELPRQYELVFLLHVLYHLRNPLLALETLTRYAHHCIFSTRVANTLSRRRLPWPRLDITHAPVGYLLDAGELNPHDAYSYWIFSEAGLRRVLARTGWQVLSQLTIGDPRLPPDDRNQGITWCLLRSNVFSWTGGPSVTS